jgi:hypothetical protein
MSTMNSSRTIFAVALAASFATGCATPTSNPPVDIDDKIYVTGSRIPKSDRSYSGVRTTGDPNDIRDMTLKPGVYTGGGGN